ncbi:hypothetical protein [Alteromonas facilis]|uniref:hypothetical protein n=1 Tax=Alteromonas facilis TaxID=2048004 RepID=UPI001F0C2EBD|nr:hypothetical protein [Alteromonas facilis]
MPSIIDIEASGFGPDSYPIEIGIVREDGARFCRLIKPFPEWQHWSETAAELHGINRDELLHFGKNGLDVCLQINAFVGQRTLFSDGWVVDNPWLIKLYAAARCEMTFRLSPLESLLKESHILRWDSVKSDVSSELGGSRHRASVDAMIIQQTITRVLASDLAQ